MNDKYFYLVLIKLFYIYKMKILIIWESNGNYILLRLNMLRSLNLIKFVLKFYKNCMIFSEKISFLFSGGFIN